MVCYFIRRPSSLPPRVRWRGSGHGRSDQNKRSIPSLPFPSLYNVSSLQNHTPSTRPFRPLFANLPPAALTRKQRIKATRKQSKLLKDITPSIPIHEQSKDLTVEGDDAVVSLERRSEIIKSSRVARRKDIRENNFLRGL